MHHSTFSMCAAKVSTPPYTLFWDKVLVCHVGWNAVAWSQLTAASTSMCSSDPSSSASWVAGTTCLCQLLDSGSPPAYAFQNVGLQVSATALALLFIVTWLVGFIFFWIFLIGGLQLIESIGLKEQTFKNHTISIYNSS